MDIVFFHKADEPNGYLSNFYPSKFSLHGEQFNCVEQFFMWSKAKLFNDEETAKHILSETNPNRIKRLGRIVKGYQDSRWAAVRYDVMKEGIEAKFNQNEELRKKFMASSGKFAECAKNDLIWGIGLTMNDPKRIDRRQWRGRNLLGSTLEEIYNEWRD